MPSPLYRKMLVQGGLIFMKDNIGSFCYQYVVSVETGYRMFATSESKVFDILFCSKRNLFDFRFSSTSPGNRARNSGVSWRASAS